MDLQVTINQMKKNLEYMQEAVNNAKILISISEKAGQDVVSQRLKIDEMERTMQRWQSAIRETGY